MTGAHVEDVRFHCVDSLILLSSRRRVPLHSSSLSSRERQLDRKALYADEDISAVRRRPFHLFRLRAGEGLGARQFRRWKKRGKLDR